ncbi:MAG: beta-lactamase family protein [Chloroflexi bacterium]|nr:beta-lactamase family protein [Chloroflexota bacterium]
MPALNDSSARQPINLLPAAVHEALQQAIQSHLGTTFPALALHVMIEGEVVLNQAWGWIDPETRLCPTQPDSLFDLASVTKLFTATVFLALVSAGRVRLDDPLIRVIPEFGASGPRPLDGGQDPHSKIHLPTPDSVRDQTADPALVTFYHLLTHTSGLAAWRDVFNAAGPAPLPPDQTDPISRDQRWQNALRALCTYPFVGQPGKGEVLYSDLGLLLLGETVSRLHSVPLDVAQRHHLFEPLRLDSLTFNPLQHGCDRQTTVPTEIDPGWRQRRCWGEVHDENACGVGGVAGHAGLFGAARDVAALGQAWLTADPRLNLSPELIQSATRQHEKTGEMRRGLGWMMKTFEDSSAGDLFHPDSYGHTGFTGTSLWIDPARKLVIACLTNRVYPGREKPGIHPFRRAVHDLLARMVSESC